MALRALPTRVLEVYHACSADRLTVLQRVGSITFADHPTRRRDINA